jgi:SulP family sulfate permease
VLLELEGMLFLGTADELLAQAHALAPTTDFLVLGLRRIGEIDSTGARALLALAADLADSGRWLVLADLDLRDARSQTIRAMRHAEDVDTGGGVTDDRLAARGLHVEADVDMALQWAEDRLLERLGVTHAGDAALTLSQTVLGTDIAPADLAWLGTQMTELRLAPGEALFRRGDVGDALYVITQGEIAIMLPGGSGRRLASLAPGIVVGELALLQHEPRSADAVAETALTVLRLDCATFDRMQLERPALWDRLMRNLTLHLSARLRSVTVELSAALEP